MSAFIWGFSIPIVMADNICCFHTLFKGSEYVADVRLSGFGIYKLIPYKPNPDIGTSVDVVSSVFRV